MVDPRGRLLSEDDEAEDEIADDGAEIEDDDARRVFDILSQSLVDVRLVADVPNLSGLTLTTTNPATWALNGPAGGGLLLSLYSGGQTWFQLLDVATMRSALLGVVPGRYSYCSAAGRYLACAGNGGLVHVWRRSGTS